MSNDGNVISIDGGPLHFTDTVNVELYTVDNVIAGIPREEVTELVVVAKTRSGEMYVAGTHSAANLSLLMGNAQHFVHGNYTPYSGREDTQ